MLTIKNYFPDNDCIEIKTSAGETISVFRDETGAAVHVSVNHGYGETVLILGESSRGDAQE